MKYYKVVSELNMSIDKRFNIVKYIPDKFVYASYNSKLFVFSTFVAAKDYRIDSERIYECEVIKPKRIKYILLTAGNSVEIFKEFWKNKKNKKSVSGFITMKSMDDTLIVDAVKLTKRIV